MLFLILKDKDKLKEEEIADEHLEAKKDNNEKIIRMKKKISKTTKKKKRKVVNCLRSP